MQQSILQKDLMIIIEAACQMAQADSKLDEAEKELLKKIMQAGGIDTKELKKFENSNNSNIKALANQLSSVKAKRLFLLTLVGTSLADQSVDIKEKKMIDDLTKELEVGSISINKMSYKSCEELILKLISESKVIIDIAGE
jgi:uncharacterized membrane protein YebE (DUF533 family)